MYLDPRLTPAATRQLEERSKVYELDAAAMQRTIQILENMISKLGQFAPRQGRLLDVGCNRGLVLEAARRVGWQVTGVDISRAAIESARREFGLDVYCGEVDDLPPTDPFDLVVCWHVLEHTRDPVRFLCSVRRTMAADGVLALQVPSYASLPLYQARNELIKIICSVHNFYFTPSTLRRVLAAARLQPVLLRSSPQDPMLTTVCRKTRLGASVDCAQALLGRRWESWWRSLAHRLLRGAGPCRS